MTTTVTDVQQPNYRRRQQEQRIELTPEEAKAWQECMKNSSVIAPTFFSAVTGYGLCRLSSFHTYAKYAGLFGGVLGMIIGRMANSALCLAKIASMPNSTLMDRLAEANYKNRGAFREERDFRPLDVQSEIQGPSEPSTGITFDDYPSMNAYDTYSNINDSDSHISEDTDLTEPINLQKGVSYDELRHKNRDEFYKKNNKHWLAPRTRESTVAKETSEQVPAASNQSPMQERTKYGDVWG